MNDRQIKNQIKYEMAKIDTIDRPGAIDRKYFAKILMADSHIRERERLRSFDGIASYIDNRSNKCVSVANPNGKKKDMVALFRVGFVDGYENSRCKCNGSHHEISILPDGEMILHAHDIDNDDEKKTQVLQALSRLGGGTGNRTHTNKAEHRCAEIKRLYTKAMKNGRSGLNALEDHEKTKLPGWVQRVIVARSAMNKLATGYGFTGYDLDYIRETSVWNNAFTASSAGDRCLVALNECYKVWKNLLYTTECPGFEPSSIPSPIWARLYLRTRLLWAHTEDSALVGGGGRNSIVLAVDPNSRLGSGPNEFLDGSWFDRTMSDEGINAWSELVHATDRFMGSSTGTKWARMNGGGVRLKDSWAQLLDMAYSNKPTRVLAWNKTDKLFFADCERGQVPVNYSWRPDPIYNKVAKKQLELFLGKSNETTMQNGWRLTNIFRVEY